MPVQEALRQGRLVDEENLHMTLTFLDDQPGAVLEELDTALGEIRVPDWEMEFTGVEVKGGRRPALVWADVAKVEPLRQLHDKARRGPAGGDRPAARAVSPTCHAGPVPEVKAGGHGPADRVPWRLGRVSRGAVRGGSVLPLWLDPDAGWPGL